MSTSPTLIEPDDTSAYSLKILWYARLHPSLNSKWISFFVYFNITMCIGFIVLAVKGILVSYSTDPFFMSECIQTCFLVTHSVVKFILLHKQKDAMLSLIKQKAQFWKIAEVADPKLYSHCVKIFRRTNTFLRIYFTTTVLAGVAFSLQPFITGLLPSGCYVPEGWFYYLAVAMWYIDYVMVATIGGTDCFFCSLAVAAFIQFKLLASKLKNLDFSRGESQMVMWNDLKKLVNYHNFMLNYCKELNSVFTGLFLFLFGTCIAASSVSIFIFMQPGHLSNRIKFMIYFLNMTVETAFYCVPLEIVRSTAEDLGDALYESNWYEISSTQFKKGLALVIRRAQKQLNFTGYGLIDMNLRTYVLLCKTVFSFYTYLNSIQKISNK